MKRQTPYAEAFKQEAIKLVTEQGMTVTQVARDLDVSLDTLHRWLRAARSAAEPLTDASTSSAEHTRLRREIEQLRMERDILKKCSASFRGCHNEAEVYVCGSPGEHVSGHTLVPSAWGRP